jgi:hypothetical protein
MSATEVIEQIRQLPPEEQEQVVAFVKSLAVGDRLREEPSVSYMDSGKAKALSTELFTEHAELFRKLAK